MSTVSGQFTLSSTGAKSINIGLDYDELDFYCGPRSGMTEVVGYLNRGHADASYQFAFAHKDSKSKCVTNKCILAYDSAGNVVLEAEYTGKSGTSIQLNCTAYSISYPIQVVGRNAA